MEQVLMFSERKAFMAFCQAVSRYGSNSAESMHAKECWDTAKAELLSFMKGGVPA